MFDENDEHFQMMDIRPQMPTLAFEAERVASEKAERSRTQHREAARRHRAKQKTA